MTDTRIFTRRGDLADILREAEAAHHEREPHLPEHNWADWYAEFVRARLNSGIISVATRMADSRITKEELAE